MRMAIVRRLAADLNAGTEIVICPTVRDADGLALSSRNARLDPAERRQALAIPAALSAADDAFRLGTLKACAVPHRDFRRQFYFLLHKRKQKSQAITRWLDLCRGSGA